MQTFVVGIADDDEKLHNSLKEYLHKYDSSIGIQSFYFTSEVEDFLYETPEGLDILFLDYHFEGSTSGLEALPTISEYAPKLPIVLLTSMDIELNYLAALSKKYNIAYIEKPIGPKQLAIKIENIKKQKSEYIKLQSNIDLSLKLLVKGNINSLKEYLQNDLNDKEKILLYNLEKFLESIKICSKYEIIHENLNNFAIAIKKFENESFNASSLKSQDKQTFHKVFIYILENIKPVLEYRNKFSCMCKIIKWCATNGFLQQAVTFYIEWLPLYLTNSYLIEVTDNNIIKSCNINKHSWEPWQRYFIRSFKYKQTSQSTTNNTVFCNKAISEIILKLKTISNLSPLERDRQLATLSNELSFTGLLVKKILSFAEKTNKNFVDDVMNLNKNDIIYKLLSNACPSNISFKKFLVQRIQNEKDIKNILVKAVFSIKKQNLREILVDLFGVTNNTLNEPTHITSGSTIENNYLKMLDNNAITINFPIQNLVKFTEQYRNYNTKFRNQINHANNNFDEKVNGSVITASIIESVNLIDSEC